MAKEVLYRSINQSIHQFIEDELGERIMENPPSVEGVGQDSKPQRQGAQGRGPGHTVEAVQLLRWERTL